MILWSSKINTLNINVGGIDLRVTFSDFENNIMNLKAKYRNNALKTPDSVKMQAESTNHRNIMH